MTLYDAEGNVLYVYGSDGSPFSLYGAEGNVVSGPGEPLPPTDPLSIYARNEHPNHLADWWGKLAAVDSTRATVMWGTNSLYGYYANDIPTVDYPALNTLGHVGRNRAALATRHGDRGEGVIPFTDWRWTTTGTSTSDTYGFAMRGQVVTAGQSITLTGVSCSRIVVSRPVRSLPDVAPAYVVDGGTPVAGSTGTVVGEIVRDTLAVADGTHTLVVQGPGSGSVTIGSVAVYRGSSTGGVVNHRNSSPGGYTYNFLEAKSGDATGTLRRLTYTLDEYNVDLLVLAFGHNEWRSGQALGTPITPTRFYDDTMFILDHQCGVRGKNAALPIGPGGSIIGSPTYSEEAFWDVYREIAAANDLVDCFDYRPIIGPYVAPGVGTWVDGIHQNGAGHDLMHRVDMASLFPTGAALEKRIADAA